MTDLEIQEIINSMSESLGVPTPVQHMQMETPVPETQGVIEPIAVGAPTTEASPFDISASAEDSDESPVEDNNIDISSESNESTLTNRIPENPVSELSNERSSRFSSAPWFNTIQSQDVTIAGLGGIGSWTALLISRMNPSRIWLYDDDTVDTVNMSGQLYSTSQIGRSKVDGTINNIHQFSDYHCTVSRDQRYTEHSTVTPIMICGFDNMAARKTFFTTWYNCIQRIVDKSKYLFIDGRMAAESFQIFCITGDDDYNINRYRQEFLFSDEEADETVCSYKQTTYMASMIGATINNLVVNFVNNITPGTIQRYLPFFTEYSGDTMYLKTIL